MIHPTCPTCDHCTSYEFDNHNGKAAIVYQCDLDESAEPLPSSHYCSHHTAKNPPIYDSVGPWRTVEVNGTKYVELEQAVDLVRLYVDALHEMLTYISYPAVKAVLNREQGWHNIESGIADAKKLIGGHDDDN